MTATSWKHPRCPSEGDCTDKLWAIQTAEYYLVLKRNELSNHEKTWRKLDCILLNESHQSEKVPYCVILKYVILPKASLRQ